MTWYRRNMSREITLEIPDGAYQALVQRSAVLKRQPEQVAAEVLADSLTDPLLQLSGSISTERTNVSDAHDSAFGEPEL